MTTSELAVSSVDLNPPSDSHALWGHDRSIQVSISSNSSEDSQQGNSAQGILVLMKEMPDRLAPLDQVRTEPVRCPKKRRFIQLMCVWIIPMITLIPFGIGMDVVLHPAYTPWSNSPYYFHVICLSVVAVTFSVVMTFRICICPNSFWFEFFVFVLVFILFQALTYSQSTAQPSSFHMVQQAKNLLVNEEFNYSDSPFVKTYYDMKSIEEFWHFLRGPFFRAFYPNMEKSFPSNSFVNDGHWEMFEGFSVRQKRARYGSCEPLKIVFHVNGTKCAAALSDSSEMKEPFYGTKSGRKYEWSDGSFVSTLNVRKQNLSRPSATGDQTIYYSPGGYMEKFRTSIKSGKDYSKWLEGLIEDDWIDQNTRAVFIETGFGAFQDKIWIFFTVMIEFTSSGAVIPSNPIVETGLYFEFYDMMRLYGHVNWPRYYYPILLAALYFIAEIFIDLDSQTAKRYFFGSAWRFIDVITILNMLVVVALSYYESTTYPSSIFSWSDFSDSNTNWYADFYSTCHADSTRRKFIALCVFGLWLRVIKYLHVIPALSFLGSMLSLAAPLLLCFFILFTVLLVAFAQMFLIIFSGTVYDFRSTGNSIFSLVAGLTGSLNVQAMRDQDNYFGSILYVLFLMIMGWTLLTVILAVVNDSFVLVKDTGIFHKRHRILPHNWRYRLPQPVSIVVNKVFPLRNKDADDDNCSISEIEDNSDDGIRGTSVVEVKAPLDVHNGIENTADMSSLTNTFVSMNSRLEKQIAHLEEQIRNLTDIILEVRTSNGLQDGDSFDIVKKKKSLKRVTSVNDEKSYKNDENIHLD